MTALQERLPGQGVTVRIVRDDSVTFAGVTVAPELYNPAFANTTLAAATGLSAGEQSRARNAAPVTTRLPREPVQEGPGWAVFSFPGSLQAYVQRDDMTHLSFGAAQSLFTRAMAATAILATAGLSASEQARANGLAGR